MHPFLMPLMLALLLAGCASPPAALTPPAANNRQADHRWSAQDQAHWEKRLFPGKAETVFTLTQKDQQPALKATAESSASMLRQKLAIAPEQLGDLDFSVYVQDRMNHADLASREKDDSPFRVILSFDGDTSTFSAADRGLSELSRLLTGEPMPYATLMYVWCNVRPVGTVVHNPRTQRIRKIVVGSGRENHQGSWLKVQRNIQQDFKTAFGEGAGTLTGIGIMTDSDNTRSQVSSYYGEISLSRPGSTPRPSPPP
jgi:hypothetical protein